MLRPKQPLEVVPIATDTPHEAAQPNRLIHAQSPYLRQHAHNPVDWFPWGEQALAKAEEEDKPLFVSIGYSTCHWCHVMAHESFEDPDVARLMNEAFVNVKVDREERPDLDDVYMTVCQLLTGQGGWPLNVILTPDKRPFFAATYIPKEARFGRKGMRELVPRVQQLWAEGREDVLHSAERITEALTQTSVDNEVQDELTEAHLRAAYEGLRERFDEAYGGIGSAPKFPSPHNLTFLLRYAHRTGDDEARRMAEQTLDAMRRGGVHDHVGFGFHRYSTDRQWHLPHFEKMLYDQATTALAYLEGYQATGRSAFAETARGVFAYVRRDLLAPEGAFYSAEDADSEGEEGKFYVWTDAEIRAALDEAEADLVIEAFGVDPDGNYREEATGEATGRNVLHLQRELTESERAVWARARETLYGVREQRTRPDLDDKILTDWNGLMIAALARGAAVLDEARYAEAARRAADFLLETMRDDEGGLRHRYREGEAGVAGFLDDYAFLAWGLIELYEATFEPPYLESALELTDAMLARFEDAERGGCYFVPPDADDVLVRRKSFEDRAMPSGNSVAMFNLVRLARLTGRTDFEEHADRLSRAASARVNQIPIGFTHLLAALDLAVGPSQEVVIVGDPDDPATQEALQTLREAFRPRTVVVLKPSDADDDPIVDLAPFTRDMRRLDGATTIYVCQGHRCDRPTADIAAMRELLQA